MSINKLYNNENFMEHLLKECEKSYYKYDNWVVRTNYEFDEFVNEVNVYIIKYWNDRDKDYSIEYWIHLIVDSTMKDLYKGLKTYKRGELNDDSIYRIDSVINENSEDKNISLEITSKSNFDIHKYIQYVCSMIPNMIDKQICELYLLGYTTIKISEIVGLSARQVRYKINNKYNKIFQDSYFEYKASII